MSEYSSFRSDAASEPMGKLLKPAVKSRKLAGKEKSKRGFIGKFKIGRTRTYGSSSHHSASDASVATPRSRKKTALKIAFFNKKNRRTKSRMALSSEVLFVDRPLTTDDTDIDLLQKVSEMKKKHKTELSTADRKQLRERTGNNISKMMNKTPATTKSSKSPFTSSPQKSSGTLRIKHPIDFILEAQEKPERPQQLSDCFKREDSDDDIALSDILSDDGDSIAATTVKSGTTKGRYLEGPDLQSLLDEVEREAGEPPKVMPKPVKKKRRKRRKKKRVTSVKVRQQSEEEKTFLEAEGGNDTPLRRSPQPKNPFEDEEGSSKNSLRKTFVEKISSTLSRNDSKGKRRNAVFNPGFKLAEPELPPNKPSFSKKVVKTVKTFGRKTRTLSGSFKTKQKHEPVFTFEQPDMKKVKEADTPTSGSTTSSMLERGLRKLQKSLKRFTYKGNSVKHNSFIKRDAERSMENKDWTIKYIARQKQYRFYNKKTKETSSTRPSGFRGSVWVKKFAIGKCVWLNVETKEERECKTRPE